MVGHVTALTTEAIINTLSHSNISGDIEVNSDSELDSSKESKDSDYEDDEIESWVDSETQGDRSSTSFISRM